MSADTTYTQLARALEEAEYNDDGYARIEPEVLKQVLADLNTSAVRDFIRRMLANWDDAHGPEESDPELFETQLLDGLRALGWSDVPPVPLFQIAELIARLRLLLLTPWSGDNTYEQGVKDAIDSLSALYLGKPFAPEWNRCTATRARRQCVLQLPHEVHSAGDGITWKDPES